jgi:hypothetical protein
MNGAVTLLPLRLLGLQGENIIFNFAFSGQDSVTSNGDIISYYENIHTSII